MYQKIQGLKDWKEDISNQEKVTLKCLDHNFKKFELKQGIFKDFQDKNSIFVCRM